MAVNIDVCETFREEPRFRALVVVLGDEDRAVGMCIRAWILAARRWEQRLLISHDDWDLEKLEPLITCRLARRETGGVYVCGTAERAEWRAAYRESRKAGGKARAEAAPRTGGRFMRKDDPPPATSIPPASHQHMLVEDQHPTSCTSYPILPSSALSYHYENNDHDTGYTDRPAEPLPTPSAPATPVPGVAPDETPPPPGDGDAPPMRLAPTRLPDPRRERHVPDAVYVAPEARRVRLPRLSDLMAQPADAANYPAAPDSSPAPSAPPVPSTPAPVRREEAASPSAAIAAFEAPLVRDDPAAVALPRADAFASTAQAAADVIAALGLPADFGLPEKRHTAPRRGTASAPGSQTGSVGGLPSIIEPAASQVARRAKRPRGEGALADADARSAKAVRDTARAAYMDAYLARYGTLPVMAAKQNSQLKQFVDQIGSESADVLRYYLDHGKRHYIDRCHDLGVAVSDAAALRMQWATNTKVTSASAQQGDREATNNALVLAFINKDRTG